MDSRDLNNFLNTISSEPLQVIDSEIPIEKYVAIDLSASNAALEHLDVSSSKAWEQYINTYLEKRDANVAFGGYLERRDIYRRSSYFKQSSDENERNIHLGIDLWCQANTKVLAVLDGEIHSFQNNTNFGDYGPTIIVKHTLQDVIFYSLYGHLTLDSIRGIAIGEKVLQGQTIGYLGDHTVNGDYAPHLHFQLVVAIEEKSGDYPGVCSAKNLDFYRYNCPDPNALLKLAERPNTDS